MRVSYRCNLKIIINKVKGDDDNIKDLYPITQKNLLHPFYEPKLKKKIIPPRVKLVSKKLAPNEITKFYDRIGSSSVDLKNLTNTTEVENSKSENEIEFSRKGKRFSKSSCCFIF